jgi:hypothetical protein
MNKGSVGWDDFCFYLRYFSYYRLCFHRVFTFLWPSYREALAYSLQLVTRKSSSGTQTMTSATHTAYRTVQRDRLTYIAVGSCSDTTDSDHCFHSQLLQVCLTANLNCDSAVTKVQLPFVKENRSVSTTNERQNQRNIKHNKVGNFSFQALPLCGGTGWCTVRDGWQTQKLCSSDGGAVRP